MRRGEALILAGFTAASVLTLVLAGYQEFGEDRWLSPTSRGPRGTAGLAEALARLGAEVEVRRRSLLAPVADGDATGTTLVLAAGPSHDSVLARNVFDFVVQGGHLVVTGDWHLTECVGRTLQYEDGDWDEATLEEVEVPAWCPSIAWHPDTTQLMPSDESLVARMTHENGGLVTIVARGAWLSNESLRHHKWRGDILGLVHAGRTERVLFQEPLEAGATRLIGAVGRWAFDAPLGWMLVQLGLAGAALVLLGAVRTGPVTPLIDRRRRSAVEHADALAVGLRRAGGAETAVTLLVAGLRRRLRGRSGSATARENRAWLDALARASDDPGIRGTIRELANLQVAADGDAAVLAAATLVEDVWNTVGRRTP